MNRLLGAILYQFSTLTDTLEFLRQSNFHFQAQMMPAAVLLALDFGYMVHIDRLLVAFGHILNHLSNRVRMEWLVFSIYSILSCVGPEYRNCNRHPKEVKNIFTKY